MQPAYESAEFSFEQRPFMRLTAAIVLLLLIAMGATFSVGPPAFPALAISGVLMLAVLPLMFWITPIVYPLSIVDERVQGLFAFNPMTHFTSAYQAALAFGTLPDLQPLLVVVAVSLLLLWLNLVLYRRLRSDLVDML